MTFNEAFAAFILAYERNAELQARCSAGENFDLAECVYVRYLLTQAGEALLQAAEPLR
jgi:hypothetical protein